MKLGTLFFVVVSFIQGYVLWSYAIITPRWTVMPGYPMPEPGRTIRTFSILVVIVAAFVFNFIINRLVTRNDPLWIFLKTMVSANVALAFTLLLSQLFDKLFEMPSPLIGDTIWQLTNNPSILVAVVMVANLAGLVSFGAGMLVNTILGGRNAPDIES